MCSFDKYQDKLSCLIGLTPMVIISAAGKQDLKFPFSPCLTIVVSVRNKEGQKYVLDI